MVVLRTDPLRPEPESIARAAAILRAGGLVVFPTETVYGLGADATDAEAVSRIYEAKGRPPHNPLITHVAEVDQARALAGAWPDAADALAAAFWPGPLTLVLPRGPRIPAIVSAGLATFGVRIPAHPVAQALLHAADLPVAAPSANAYTHLSPTRAGHVIESLGGRFDLLLDAGPTPVGIESTVLDLTAAVPCVLRPGSVTIDDLRGVLPDVTSAAGGSERAPRSPGRDARHYAPRTPAEPVADARTALDRMRDDDRVGALLIEDGSLVDGPRLIVLPADPRLYATALYAALHELDGRHCSRILVQRPPAGAVWDAVRDRLARATAGPA
jgi:L-threonylcarbamoyladenylate synthase